jgi:glycosyltransferase involved in cell wall biosynthesis
VKKQPLQKHGVNKMETTPAVTEAKAPVKEDIVVKRVLVLADFGCNSGFAQVAHHIVAQLLKDKKIAWQFDIVGINYYGLPNEWYQVYPRVRQFPATTMSHGDLFGREAYLNFLASGAYDLTFILQDTFIVESIAPKILEIRKNLAMANKKVFKWIFYFPIDASPKENWVKDSICKSDVPVSYTQYGFDECVYWEPSLEKRLKIIPHGVDTDIFRPVDKKDVEKFRHEYFTGRADGKWLITNVNRNQARKDIARTLQVYSLLKKRVPDAMLYLHMKANDVAYNIHEAARCFDLTHDDFIIPADFDEHEGIPVDYVNMIYNSSQALMTTTLGEGWGLSLTEAMAAKCPVVAPGHTSINEILGDGRGLITQAGRSTSEWIMLPMGDNERLRPLASVADMVEKLAWLHDNYQSAEVTNMVEKAYTYATTQLNWDDIGEKWREVFNDALVKNNVQKIGRNDLCYCGSGLKYKKCHGRN